jgi:signal transduction histidine kinase
VALVLSLGAITALVTLERRAAGSRDAQVSLATIAAQLTQIEVIPMTASSIPGTKAQQAQVLEGVLSARTQAIMSTFGRLQRGSPPAELRSVDGPLRAALAAADAALPIWGLTEGMTPSKLLLLTRVGTTLATALRSLDDANRAYGARASTLQTEALSGSAAVVVILLAAFGFFFRRSEASRRKLDAQGGTLRVALSELEAVQTDRARLLQRTVEIAERERTRVAVDLHDGPIQGLTAVTLGFDMLANQLERGNLATAPALVEEIREALAEETVSLRRLMAELRPPIIDARDLRAALRDCAAQVFEGSAVRWEVNATHPVTRLAPEVETVAYRVVREALVNVRKHAPDAHASVTLEPLAELLRITVVDDGPGFDESTPLGQANGVRYGLIGMRERVESVDGTWSLTTAPGGGTRVEFVLPRRVRLATASPELVGVAA